MAAIQLIDNDYDMDTEIKRIVKAMIYALYMNEEENELKIKSDGFEILRVAYTFDMMTAMNYEEEPLSEIAALRHLLQPENGFPQEVVEALVESVNILQPGVCVEMTNGDRGLVVKGNEEDVLAPMILSFRDNLVYNMADKYTAKEIQIKDIMKTMDNRHVVDTNMLEKYMGETVHIGQKRSKKSY